MKLDINSIPEKIKDGKLTAREAVNQLAVFIVQNPAIFGLPKNDEDLISEVVMHFLEKSENSFEHFNPNYGSFFTYFFCYVKSVIITCSRKRMTRFTQDSHSINESILDYDSHNEAYSSIDFNEIGKGTVPYSIKKIPVEAFQLASKSEYYKIKKIDSSKNNLPKIREFSEHSTKIERIILILALKSSYYITDEQITRISEICRINENHLRDAIHLLNQDLIEKAERHISLVNRRNRAYYLKKKYENELSQIELNNINNLSYSKDKITKKYENQSNHLELFNELLKNGVINIRPTNKAVADIMGLCERQISYYLNKAKSLTIEE